MEGDCSEWLQVTVPLRGQCGNFKGISLACGSYREGSIGDFHRSCEGLRQRRAQPLMADLRGRVRGRGEPDAGIDRPVQRHPTRIGFTGSKLGHPCVWERGEARVSAQPIIVWVAI